MILSYQGKDVFTVDAYAVAAWQPPHLQDPLLSLPVSTWFLLYVMSIVLILL